MDADEPPHATATSPRRATVGKEAGLGKGTERRGRGRPGGEE